MSSKKRRKAREWMHEERCRSTREVVTETQRAYARGIADAAAREEARRRALVEEEQRDENTYCFIGKNPFPGEIWQVPIYPRNDFLMRADPRALAYRKTAFQKVQMGMQIDNTVVRWFNIAPVDDCKPVAFGLEGLASSLRGFLSEIAYIMNGHLSPYEMDASRILEAALPFRDTRLAHHYARIVAMMDRVSAALETGAWDPRNMKARDAREQTRYGVRP